MIDLENALPFLSLSDESSASASASALHAAVHRIAITKISEMLEIIFFLWFYRRIRDNMEDKHVQTMVKQVDAVEFALGVLLTMLVEYIVLAKPEYLAPFSYCLMPTLFIHR